VSAYLRVLSQTTYLDCTHGRCIGKESSMASSPFRVSLCCRKPSGWPNSCLRMGRSVFANSPSQLCRRSAFYEGTQSIFIPPPYHPHIDLVFVQLSLIVFRLGVSLCFWRHFRRWLRKWQNLSIKIAELLIPARESPQSKITQPLSPYFKSMQYACFQSLGRRDFSGR
jgi:hypothetical protein